jgi:hypothetical protein
MKTEATHTPPQPAAVGAQVDRPVRPGAEAVQPIAYLYHDAASAETANPLIHSTLVVMAADRKPTLRNETPLVTLAQAQAMVDAERERLCAAIKAADDKAVDEHEYMLTSNDCISVIQGTWE